MRLAARVAELERRQAALESSMAKLAEQVRWANGIYY